MAEEVPRPFEDAPRTEWAARWHQWRGDRRVAAALLACIALAGAVAWFRAGVSSSSSAASLSSLSKPPGASGTTESFATTTSTTRVAAVIVVDVVGAVRHPAVVRLAGGARVVDAIAAAGGATADADLARLNLAAPLTDGARVAVPRVGAPALAVDPGAVIGAPSGTDGDSAPSASAPVDLNTATAAQLDTLPGVGPATAAAIISDREAHGPFRSVNDLGRVRGIGDAKLDQLRKFVTV